MLLDTAAGCGAHASRRMRPGWCSEPTDRAQLDRPSVVETRPPGNEAKEAALNSCLRHPPFGAIPSFPPARAVAHRHHDRASLASLPFSCGRILKRMRDRKSHRPIWCCERVADIIMRADVMKDGARSTTQQRSSSTYCFGIRANEAASAAGRSAPLRAGARPPPTSTFTRRPISRQQPFDDLAELRPTSSNWTGLHRRALSPRLYATLTNRIPFRSSLLHAR